MDDQEETPNVDVVTCNINDKVLVDNYMDSIQLTSKEVSLRRLMPNSKMPDMKKRRYATQHNYKHEDSFWMN